jgi:hypothetical protein
VHGTLGIVYALAATGRAAGRAGLTELALAGAADVVSRNEAGPDGFLVPHSDPQHKPERIERYSYGWCHGPAGDAQAFRLLARQPWWEPVRAGLTLRPRAEVAARPPGPSRLFAVHSAWRHWRPPAGPVHWPRQPAR